jgi:hypothetical protein
MRGKEKRVHRCEVATGARRVVEMAHCLKTFAARDGRTHFCTRAAGHAGPCFFIAKLHNGQNKVVRWVVYSPEGKEKEVWKGTRLMALHFFELNPWSNPPVQLAMKPRGTKP